MSSIRTRAPATPPPVRPNVIVLVPALSGIVVSLMQTLVIPLVPLLPDLLGATVADTAWVITATLLAAALAAFAIAAFLPRKAADPDLPEPTPSVRATSGQGA